MYLHPFLTVLPVFPQRGERGRGLLGSSKEDLPEHPRWQSGPERCRVRSPAQTICAAGRPPQRRQPAGQRRLQLLTTDRNYRPIRQTDGRTKTDRYVHRDPSPPGTNMRLLFSVHQTGFSWITFNIAGTVQPPVFKIQTSVWYQKKIQPSSTKFG